MDRVKAFQFLCVVKEAMGGCLSTECTTPYLPASHIIYRFRLLSPQASVPTPLLPPFALRCSTDAGSHTLPLNIEDATSAGYRDTRTSSTSKLRVELGGMSGGAPLAP